MHSDIRQYGSGNPGSANVLRAFGAKAAIAVFLIDALKGYISMQLPLLFGIKSDVAWLFCGLAVISGHNWPVTLKFKGGKGVATTIGASFAFAPLLTFIILIISLIVVAITKYVSVGALFGIGIASVILLFTNASAPIKALACINFALSLFQHRGNIQRLMSGTESKFNQKSGKNAG